MYILIDIIKATKGTNSASSRERAIIKSGSSGSSDVQMTKLQLGTNELNKSGTKAKPKNKKRKGELVSDKEDVGKQIRFDKLDSPRKGNNKLLQLIKETPELNEKKERVSGRLSKARKFPIHSIDTNNLDKEKLKSKLLDKERDQRRPLAQMRNSKTISSTTALIQLGSDTGSSHGKHGDLDTSLSLSRTPKHSAPKTESPTRASTVTRSISSTGSKDVDERPNTH